MFNKKAIAALAAGATLVSGLAFAAPAMADNNALDFTHVEFGANGFTAVTYRPATNAEKGAAQDALEAAQKALQKLKDNANSDEANADRTAYNKKVAAAQKAVEDAQAKVDELNNLGVKVDGKKGGSSTANSLDDLINPKKDDKKDDKKNSIDDFINVGPKTAKESATMESLFGTDTLYTNYKGLTVELIQRGITNIAAYDALLDKLEFGLKQTGWANILKNFGGDNCAYLGKLRRQLQKAVKHYKHVEAAVVDIQAELNEDYKDAKANEDWDAAKVIKGKLAQAKGLLEVAHHNRTRAEAILDSANDHARDLSCDTGAKDVLKALKGAKADKKADKKADAKKAAPLAKTGAVVALAAVAASVLAGMGAALRKIRH
ncbi:hypothetical protein CJ216_04355 [Gardnerella greenwoodii]|uniref:Peptidase n=2 Tax=Gardnerella greenwoodii TaxID=2914925 RepID=A0A2N6RYV6_9BIFI|nr:hypothetical protein [Gardnerella greenwoodii]PMC43301.1 hypothetical protein CJ216_04355 [Gardnerella greenwoodii]